MAKRKNSYRGTAQQHRADAAAQMEVVRDYMARVRQHSLDGECDRALEWLVAAHSRVGIKNYALRYATKSKVRARIGTAVMTLRGSSKALHNLNKLYLKRCVLASKQRR